MGGAFWIQIELAGDDPIGAGRRLADAFRMRHVVEEMVAPVGKAWDRR